MTIPARCLDCGLPYSEFPLDVILPRSQWLDIHPNENGLLCAACIVKRCAKIPGATVVRAIVEITPSNYERERCAQIAEGVDAKRGIKGQGLGRRIAALIRSQGKGEAQ